MAYDFTMPAHVVLGAGALETSASQIKKLGSRALIVTDKLMTDLGNVAPLTALLQKLEMGYAVYDQIDGEPTDIMVENGLEVYKRENCDCLIALGGGSALDTMKAIGALAGNGGSISDYMGVEIAKAAPPMAAIPTTAGTGSEATKFTIITDTKRQIKMLLKGDVLMPNLAIIDPAFTMTMPPSVTAATGLDAFTHAVEAYTSKKATALSDLYALSAVKRIMRALPVAFQDGKKQWAREEMSMAAFEAGVAFNNASVTVVHGMSRPIGALFHVPHGISNAMLLPDCLEAVLDGAYERFAMLGRQVGAAGETDSDEGASRLFLEAARELCRICQIPTLAGYGIDRGKFFASLDKMAEDAMASGSPGNTRKKLEKSDLIDIYKKLWD